MRIGLAALSGAFLMCLTVNAHAYLDPGTGSILLQGLIAAVAGSIVAIKMYWYKVKALLGMGAPPSGDTPDQA